MEPTGRLNELREVGRLLWRGSADGWAAEPYDVVDALTRDGFEEYKHEETRDRGHRTRGGVWQGLNRNTGAVASAVWISGHPLGGLVFIEIDGEPVRED
jgi:hypothetical protein